MSSEQSTPEAQRLLRQVDEMADLSSALCQALRRARVVRTVLVVAMAALLVAIVLLFYRLGSRIGSEDNLHLILQTGAERLQQNSDKYLGEFEKLGNACEPALKQAIDKQAQQDAPRYMKAVDKERPILITHLRERLSDRLQKHYHAQLEHKEKILMEEQPLTKDEKVRQQLISNLNATVDGLSNRYYVKPFQFVIDGLNQAWNNFPVAEKPKPGDLSTFDQGYLALMKLLALKLPTGAARAGH
jgi:hypothetical protein